MWYDKQGNPISQDIAKVLYNQKNYRRVALTDLKDYSISTVWIGLDFSISNNKMIFETMIFRAGTFDDVYCERYSTEKEAKLGHLKAVYIAHFREEFNEQ